MCVCVYVCVCVICVRGRRDSWGEGFGCLSDGDGEWRDMSSETWVIEREREWEGRDSVIFRGM